MSLTGRVKKMAHAEIIDTRESTEEKCIHRSEDFAGQFNNIRFNRNITLSPDLQAEAWSNLNVDILKVEYHELPQRLHNDLVNALGSAKRLRNVLGKKRK